jgi:hypothetical protein
MVTSRIWFRATQKAELWERWKSGLSVAAISRALDRRNKTGVLRVVTLAFAEEAAAQSPRLAPATPSEQARAEQDYLAKVASKVLNYRFTANAQPTKNVIEVQIVDRSQRPAARRKDRPFQWRGGARPGRARRRSQVLPLCATATRDPGNGRDVQAAGGCFGGRALAPIPNRLHRKAKGCG